MNYVFEPGGVLNQPERTLQQYRDMTETDIVLSLAQPFFDTLKECSNYGNAFGITMKDLYCYHALLTLTTYLPLPDISNYWKPVEGVTWDAAVRTLTDIFNIRRYYFIRSKLKGYLPEDDTPQKGRGWKVQRAVAAVQQTFRTCMDRPSQFLSLDEGMAQGSSTRNPIYCSLGKAKPLEGFRFFILCEYNSKVVINIMLDDV